MVMVANISSTSTDIKSSNKWLMLLLLLTVITTAWTALHDESAQDATVELVEQKSLSDTPSLAKQMVIPAKLDQHLKTEQADTFLNKSSIIPWQALKREPLKDKSNDLFKVHSWVVIPPVKKLKPPPPVAPPAPFTYMGKLEDSPKGTLIFLMANGKLYSVAKGEKIDQQWMLEGEDANTLKLSYGPLNLVQTLSKSSKPAVMAPVAALEMNR